MHNDSNEDLATLPREVLVQEAGRRDAYFGWDLMHVRWLLAAQLAAKLSHDIMIRNGVLM